MEVPACFSMQKKSRARAFDRFPPSNSRRLFLNATNTIPAELAAPHLVGQASNIDARRQKNI
jgi:hypothetical protein